MVAKDGRGRFLKRVPPATGFFYCESPLSTHEQTVRLLEFSGKQTLYVFNTQIFATPE